MQVRPFLIKIRQKLKAWLVKYRPRVKLESIDNFFAKHWAGTVPSSDYFANQELSVFFFDVNRYGEYVNALEKHFQKNIAKIIATANKFIEYRFDLLGSGETSLGDKINWHQDFKSGFEWPHLHFSRIQTVNLNDKADVKVPWELSRLQFLTTLGRAYWLTQEEKFKRKFLTLMADWEKSNPIDIGVNWTCSMEVAIRAINMIWGMYLFGDRGSLTEDFIKSQIRLLYYHGLHLEKNLEYIDRGSNTNHLLANYLGLFYIGILFPQFDQSQKWLAIGREGLEREILLQIGEDGADYECSLSYHRLVLEMFLSAFILGKCNGVVFNGEFVDRLKGMLEFSAAMTSQSGKVPSIGDNDDGFILKLANVDPHDHRALLDIGAQVLDAKLAANTEISEERLWFLGPGSLSKWPNLVHRTPRLFKQSGYAVIQNERIHLTFNACGISDKGFGGHKHNDLLSINLEIDSVPFLIDAGTACYTSDYKLRNRSRSTLMHNTIAVDNEEQSRYLEKALFFMFKDARPRIDLWTVTDTKVMVSGHHDGYGRLGNSIIHRRTIEVDLVDLSIAIQDEIRGEVEKVHLIECNYLTPWECHNNKNNKEVRIKSNTGSSLSLSFAGNSDCELITVPTEYFPNYGVTAVGTQIRCQCRTRLPFTLKTHFSYESAKPLITLQQLTAGRLSPALKTEVQEVR